MGRCICSLTVPAINSIELRGALFAFTRAEDQRTVPR